MGGLGVKVQHFPLTLLIVQLSHYRVSVIALFNTGAGKKVKQYYDNYVKSTNIMAVFNVSGEHTFVRFTTYT